MSNVYKLAYEAARAIIKAAEQQEPEITFPIEGFVITGKRTFWSQVVLSGHNPAPQEDVRLWVRPEGEGQVKAHVFRSTYGRPLHPGQDTIWVDCPCTEYKWQAGHDRQYGIMEGDTFAEACPAVQEFLVAIGYTEDFVVEDDVDGFLTFLNNLEANVAEWEVEDHDEEK